MIRTHAFTLPALAAVLLASGGCAPPDRELESAVRGYVARVIEAYRTSDPAPIEPITGLEEGRRLTALIGVKRDMGIVLDAQLLELTVQGIERRGGEYVVTTDERWYYRDRRIGSGEQVGPDSTDRYWMRYRLRRSGKVLLVEGADFARPPEVGRTERPAASVKVLHGVETHPPTEAPAVPGAAPAPGKGVAP